MLVVWVVCILSIVSRTSAAVSDTTCSFTYGNWTDCEDGSQNRTLSCICGTEEADLMECLKQQPSINPITRDCEEDDDDDDDDATPECKWRWTRWSKCTLPCGGGNTTRHEVCVCDGDPRPVEDDWCDDPKLFDNETATCNDFTCGSIPAFNKIYWMNKDDEGIWPIPDLTFNCSKGANTSSTDSPKGKKYSEILKDPEPENHDHFEWYFIAKEWIACQLNIANGAKFTPEALDVINEMGKLLEYCNGWPSVDKFDIYAGKEKLGRINNNLGGLNTVDGQMRLLSGGGSSEQSNTESDPNLHVPGILIMVIAIPMGAVLIIGIAIGLTVYYVREKKNAVVEQAAFESEDEPSDDTPLKSGAKHDAQTAEGQNNGGQEGVIPLDQDKPVQIGDETSEEEEQQL